jgi:thymidylate kinase
LSPQPRGVAVEFAGLPGAGKSTVAALLERSLRSRGRSYANREMIGGMELSRAQRYGRLARFYLRHPEELQAGVRLGLAVSPVSTKHLAQALQYVSVWSSRLAQAGREGREFLILDQGIIQDAWSLLLRGPWRDEVVQRAVSRAILRSGLTYALVYFDVPVDRAVQRIAQRTTMESRFDVLHPDDAARQLAAQSQRLEQLFTRVAERTGARYCRVDATQSPASICGDIETFLGTAVRPTGLEPVSSR